MSIGNGVSKRTNKHWHNGGEIMNRVNPGKLL